MSVPTELVLAEVAEERGRQEMKWGVQLHAPAKWLAILMEEVGEVAKASLDGTPENYREELVQVAAVAVAALEAFDTNSALRREA